MISILLLPPHWLSSIEELYTIMNVFDIGYQINLYAKMIKSKLGLE
ncbi:18298_t:CDS:2 [Funneliformis geosporum]|nr:18298_t:CDS:2 [Funneliformis geosporum]